MVLSRSARIMAGLIILFFTALFHAYPQCVQNYSTSREVAIHGIRNGIDHYYQNLIIQDVAIAGQQKFQDITLNFDLKLDYQVDHCLKDQVVISVMPLQVNCRPLFYQGFDIAASAGPETADLVFKLIHENGIVTDSLIFYDVRVNANSALYISQSFHKQDTGRYQVVFGRAVMQYSKDSYERFRDHMLRIDDYLAASALADSVQAWAQSGFLAENENRNEMQLRQLELERIIGHINPGNFNSILPLEQDDSKNLKEKHNVLSILNTRYKTIVSLNHAYPYYPGYAFVENTLLPAYLDHFDFYYQLAYKTDFRFGNFLNGLSLPQFSNASLQKLYGLLKIQPGIPLQAPGICSGLLLKSLLERGGEYEAKGDQLRARTYYLAANHLAKLLNMETGLDLSAKKVMGMNEAIAGSYIEISKRGARKENPVIAAQYFRDARNIFSADESKNQQPPWLNEHEKWLFDFFEDQVVVNLEKKNFKKALEYLTEIDAHGLEETNYRLPGKFTDWMRMARQGIYLEFLDRATMLMKADEIDEAEQVYRQAAEMRQRAGYRIDKEQAEAKLETAFLQMHYDDYYEEGRRNMDKKDFVPALYYFNKADYLEKSGVKEPDPGLMTDRQAAAREVALEMLSEGRLKAWASDFEGAESILLKAKKMLSDYQFSQYDTLSLLCADLERNILESECETALKKYHELLSAALEAGQEGDYIYSRKLAADAVNHSMENIKCKINDEEAWYLKITMEPLAVYQEKERELDRLAALPVTGYIDKYHELKNYYTRNKLQKRGVDFKALPDRVMLHTDTAFLRGMLDYFLFLDDYSHALDLLKRLQESGVASRRLENQQEELGKVLARRDYAVSGDVKPWELMQTYTNKDRWYSDLKRSYKKTWLEVTRWKLKFWPIIWKK